MPTDGPGAHTRCEVIVHGPLASAVLTTLRSRFTVLSASMGGGLTVLIVGDADQAALSALLTLLWDTGHAVMSMTSTGG